MKLHERPLATLQSVPIDPLLKYLGSQRLMPETVGELAQVNPKWLRGKHPETNEPVYWVDVSIPDRVLTVLSVPLWSVYPNLYDAFLKTKDGLEFGPPHQVIAAFCPKCRVMVNAIFEDGVCAWCGSQTGGSEGDGQSVTKKASEQVVRRVRARYLEGASMRAISRELRTLTSYANDDSFVNGMYREFKARGWTRRQPALAAQLPERVGQRCPGTTAVGNPCGKFPLAGSRWCLACDPQRGDELRERFMRNRSLQSLLPRAPFVDWLQSLLEETRSMAELARRLDTPYQSLWVYIKGESRASAERAHVVKMLAKARKAGLSRATLMTLYGPAPISREDNRLAKARQAA